MTPISRSGKIFTIIWRRDRKRFLIIRLCHIFSYACHWFWSPVYGPWLVEVLTFTSKFADYYEQIRRVCKIYQNTSAFHIVFVVSTSGSQGIQIATRRVVRLWRRKPLQLTCNEEVTHRTVEPKTFANTSIVFGSGSSLPTLTRFNHWVCIQCDINIFSLFTAQPRSLLRETLWWFRHLIPNSNTRKTKTSLSKILYRLTKCCYLM